MRHYGRSVPHNRTSMRHYGGSMPHNRTLVRHYGGSMPHNRTLVRHYGSSMPHNRGSGRHYGSFRSDAPSFRSVARSFGCVSWSSTEASRGLVCEASRFASQRGSAVCVATNRGESSRKDRDIPRPLPRKRRPLRGASPEPRAGEGTIGKPARSFLQRI